MQRPEEVHATPHPSAERRQRRIDRVTDASYLDGLEQHEPAAVRALRDECREEEARLSYLRRVLHGQIDLARAEHERRDRAHRSRLLDDVAEILSDTPTASRHAGQVGFYDPAVEQSRRSDDDLVHDAALSRLPELTESELTDFLARLVERERTVSAQRRSVLAHLDRLQEEMVKRYREGSASIDDIVPGRPGE